MSADYTTVGLVANAKRRGFVPSGSGLTTSDILQILSEQLRNYIPAFLKGIREEYIIASLSITVTGATISAPARACGAAFRSISWTRSDGTLRPLTQIEPERRYSYGLTGSEPSGYELRGNSFILVPAVTSGTVVVTYQQRPGQLVLPTDCAAVTSLTGGATIGATSLPSWVVAGAVGDFVSRTPNFALLAMDVVVVSAVAGVVTFTTSVPTTLAVGDYLCRAGETPVPQLPYEVHDLLAQAGAVEIARATGSERLAAIEKGLKELRADVSMILSPRNDGSPRVIVNRSSNLGRRRW